MTGRKLLVVFVVLTASAISSITVEAQGPSDRVVLAGTQLSAGFDMGVNSSNNLTNWLSQDSTVGAMKMAYPAGQAWGAVFITVGPSINPPRPGMDFSAYSTLLVEMQGDPGQTVDIGIKDKNQPDDGTETKVTVVLTSSWRTYAIPLSSFTGANLSQLYIPAEFVFANGNPITAWVRGVRYTTALAPSVNSVVNGASFQSGTAVGMWVSIFGTNLAATTRTWTSTDFQGNNLPEALSGTAVSLGERNVAVYYISPTQVNALVYSDIATGASTVTVTTSTGTSVQFNVTLRSTFPGLFTTGSGNRYAAAIHTDGTPVAPTGFFGANVPCRPAAPGEAISVYGTGFGPTTPALPANQIVQNPAPLTNASQIKATIGNLAAALLYAGLTEAGLNQFNVTVPNLANGDQLITFDLGGGVTAQAGVYIAVQK